MLKLLQNNGDTVTLELTRDDIGMITARMNEACNGLDIDFPIRTGYDRDDAIALMHALTVVRQLKP